MMVTLKCKQSILRKFAIIELTSSTMTYQMTGTLSVYLIYWRKMKDEKCLIEKAETK